MNVQVPWMSLTRMLKFNMPKTVVSNTFFGKQGVAPIVFEHVSLLGFTFVHVPKYPFLGSEMGF